ncbi:hypothetical protein KSW81_006109 [Nannochloris sp. 'desiccata']|nr:hypothetical protein KSW81_006109 [Chlorella desiccata (nom. nud.)]
MTTIYDAELVNKKVRVLVDCGSSLDAVSESFVTKNKLKTVAAASLNVKVVDGRRVACERVLKNAKLKLGCVTEVLNLRVIPMPQYNVILGLPWLQRYAVIPDWNTGDLTVLQNGRVKKVKSVTSAAKERRAVRRPDWLLSKKSFKKLLRQDDSVWDTCYMVAGEHVEELFMVELESEKSAPAGASIAAAVSAAVLGAGTSSERVPQLLKDYDTVFPPNPPGLPPDRAIVHEIKLQKGATPVHRAPYRLSVAEEDELKKRLKELSDLGLIRPSKSPWAAPVLFVPKKDGTLRFCVDYRGLNKVTIRDEHALPIPEDQIRRLHGAKVFSKIDLHSGYYQIAVAGEDVTKTAFTTTFGLYEFLVMPFGLSNAPATFSRLMMEIFKDYLYDFVLVYLDDILIFSKDEEEHEKHVRLVLDRLKEHNLIAKLSKCSFFQAEVEYLGFVVSGNGVKMAEDKVRAVLEWPTPSNATEVRGFLGLTGYYRHFIKHYAHIAAPLNELTKKSLRFLWTPLHTHAFEELKKSVTSSPVLQVYDASKQCVVCTDASNVAVGAVLLQVGESTEALRPVAFFSRKLRGAELNYDARTKEFLAIKLTAYKWKHYLNNGTTPLFYTDHQSLQYLNSQTELSPKFMRWFGSITGWLGGPPDIRYKPGKQNVVADALSRRPDHCICALSLVVPADDLIQQIRDGLKLDEFALQEAEKIKAGTSDYFWDNELLYRFINGRLQLYVPKIGNLREMLISEMHDLPLVGHQGTNRTLRRLIEQFGWPGIAKDVEEYVGGCQSCLQSKPRTGFPAGLLQPLERPGEPWESISMDFIVKLPKTKEGYDAVMVVVDRFSKYVEFVPTFTTASAEDIATLFYKNILCRHGCPSSIVSDRDSKFISSFWQSLWSSVGTRLKLSTSYHPQTDGQTERINRVLEEMLRSFCVLDPASWVNFLPQAAFAYNTAVNASLKSRPFSVVYGRTPKLPASYVAEDSRAVPVSVERFRERHEQIISKVSELLNAAQARQAFYSNKKRVDVSFDVGDEVLLNSRNLSLDGSNPPKLKPLFVGPFKILKKIGPVAYTLDMPSTFKGHTTFHVSVLKRCPNTSSKFPLRAAFSEPPPLYYQRGDAFYEVEQIVAHRGPKDAREFRIKWKGYQTRTWEPEENLLNNKFYLEYLEKLPQHNFPFTLRRRRQYPVKPAFAMSINKAQGQTLKCVGIYLKDDVFGHGQLYVALSRSGSFESIFVMDPAQEPTITGGLKAHVDRSEDKNKILRRISEMAEDEPVFTYQDVELWGECHGVDNTRNIVDRLENSGQVEVVYNSSQSKSTMFQHKISTQLEQPLQPALPAVNEQFRFNAPYSPDNAVADNVQFDAELVIHIEKNLQENVKKITKTSKRKRGMAAPAAPTELISSNVVAESSTKVEWQKYAPKNQYLETSKGWLIAAVECISNMVSGFTLEERRCYVQYLVYDGGCFLDKHIETKRFSNPAANIVYDLLHSRIAVDTFHADPGHQHSSCTLYTEGTRNINPECMYHLGLESLKLCGKATRKAKDKQVTVQVLLLNTTTD